MPPMSPVLAVGVLSALLGLQPLTTDLFLPALPALSDALQASMVQAQLTMSMVMTCFGLGQLFMGPLSDRYGRQRVLRAGLLLYTLGALAATLTPSIELLIGARSLQGLGLAAAVVCARAMVRDLYAADEGPQVMSRCLSGLGLIALLSPMLGGVTAAWLGWRGALGSVAVMSALLLGLVWFRVPETMASRDTAMPAGRWVASCCLVLSEPRFYAWAGLSAATYGGLFVFLAGSSFVAIRLAHASASTYGWMMALCSLAYLGGTAWCRRLLPTLGAVGAARRGAVFSVLGGLSLLTLSELHPTPTLWTLFVPQWIYAFGHGVLQPCGQSGAVSPFPQAAGTAASLAGFAQAATAMVSGLWLGQLLPEHGVSALAGLLCTWAIITALVAWGLVPRAMSNRA